MFESGIKHHGSATLVSHTFQSRFKLKHLAAEPQLLGSGIYGTVIYEMSKNSQVFKQKQKLPGVRKNPYCSNF
jgi:hypothetical protein